MYATKTLLKLGAFQRAGAIGVVFDLRRLKHLHEGDAHTFGDGGDVLKDWHTHLVYRKALWLRSGGQRMVLTSPRTAAFSTVTMVGHLHGLRLAQHNLGMEQSTGNTGCNRNKFFLASKNFYLASLRKIREIHGASANNMLQCFVGRSHGWYFGQELTRMHK